MKLSALCFCVLFALSAAGQPRDKPKLVVGIVVDQMRQEYLLRYYNKFGEGGFKRLINDGFMLRNAHYNYVPTVTGPGHASVYSGTTPAIHGIISNEWYDKELRKQVNCVNDPERRSVGTDEPLVSASPWRMLTSTITDELRLATQKRSRVVGIGIKDRGAILPAGHTPNGAYWYDTRTGRFITSTYYMEKLPPWVERFNKRNLADQYLSQTWKPFYPVTDYVESGPDDSPYEVKFTGKDKPVFPYDLKELRSKNGNFEMLATTPFGDDIVTELAKAAIDGESLGADEWTDFLAISYSSTDAVGHSFGPNSVEVEDMYIRLDRNLEDLLRYLDEKAGRDNYLVFLTADHAVADVAQSLLDNRIPSGYFDAAAVKTRLNEFLRQYFPSEDIVETIDGHQLFLNHRAFLKDPRSAGVDFLVATELIVNFLEGEKGVANAYSESVIRQAAYDEAGIKGMVTRGYHPKRSGDIMIVLEPGWYGAGRIEGTTHGSPYSYDTHVPLIFFGKGISKGSSSAYHAITDIAPTLCLLLDIRLPNGAMGRPITGIIDGR